MDTPGKNPENNENTQGYKVPGDGNVPNEMPAPRNRSFEENPHAVTRKSTDEIPGTEFNTGDKAFHDSSKKDYVETVSSMHHANPDFIPEADAASDDLTPAKPNADL